MIVFALSAGMVCMFGVALALAYASALESEERLDKPDWAVRHREHGCGHRQVGIHPADRGQPEAGQA